MSRTDLVTDTSRLDQTTTDRMRLAPTESMKRIEFSDLPSWNVYAERLLSATPPTPRVRDFETTQREYNELTYGTLLRHIDEIGAGATVDDVRRYQTQRGQRNRLPANRSDETTTTCISLGDELYEIDLSEAQALQFKLVVQTVASSVGDCKTIVDLGCGYGDLLNELRQECSGKRHWIGADGSTIAIQIAKRIFASDTEMHFFEFNFYDRESYRFLETAPSPIAIVTRHAIEQLPSANAVFEALSEYRSSIHCVLHFEPVYRPHDTTPLGVLRRRYVENQDYNRDLLLQIQRREGIRLVSDQPNLFGLNPLNPTSIIQWEFVE